MSVADALNLAEKTITQMVARLLRASVPNSERRSPLLDRRTGSSFGCIVAALLDGGEMKLREITGGATVSHPDPICSGHREDRGVPNRS